MAEQTPPAADDVDLIKVDLGKAITDRAAKEGTTERLDKPVTLPLRDLYKREIVQYYAGRDRGYDNGFVDGAKAGRTRPWYVWAALGAATPVVLYVAVLVVARFGKVVAAVASALSE